LLSGVPRELAEVGTNRVVGNERATALENAYGVRNVRRYHRYRPGAHSLSLSSDGDLESALDDDPDLFVGVMMLVDGASRRHVVV
jgi:hypothetical protein